MPVSDLERAYKVLQAKTHDYNQLWAYYESAAPLVYTSERLREVFQNRESRFSENWAAVVIEAELERIHLKEFTVGTDKAAAGALNDLFADTELNLDALDVHKAALVTGEAYVIAWKDDESDEGGRVIDSDIEAYYHDPRMTHLFYDPEHPRRKLFAAKWWIGEDDEKRYINLYYPDRIEYYVSTQKASSISSARGLHERQPPEDNPFGIVPVFHFRTDRRKITSRLLNVIEPQDALNKLLADMMVAAEFGAFKQRWAITNSDTKALKNAPNEIWNIPAGDGTEQPTSVGEFSATELGNYLDAIDKLSAAIGIITRTPKHFFYAQGGDPSGEALIAMEAPLNAKAQRAIDCFKPTWQELGAFLLMLSGTQVAKRDIAATFNPPQTVQPRTEAEIVQIQAGSGIPLKTALRRQGWTDADFAQMEQDEQEAAAAAPNQPEADDATVVDEAFWERVGLPNPRAGTNGSANGSESLNGTVERP